MKAKVSWVLFGIKRGSGCWLGLNSWHFSCYCCCCFCCTFSLPRFLQTSVVRSRKLFKAKKCQTKTIIQMLNCCRDLVRSFLKWYPEWLKFENVKGCGYASFVNDDYCIFPEIIKASTCPQAILII